MGHENKCAHLHGHNYVVMLTAHIKQPDLYERPDGTLTSDSDGGMNRPIRRPSDQVDDIGRVIDFSVLKERVGEWIDRNWDHGFILHQEDECAWAVMERFSYASATNQKTFELPYNPTAENMARYLLESVGPAVLADTDVELVHVRVWETENCYADASL